MAEALTWHQEGSKLALCGELNCDTVQMLWPQREVVVRGVRTFELAKLTRVDTSGIALLVHLVALAKQHGESVTIREANDKMRTLAKLYNLSDELLPFSTS